MNDLIIYNTDDGKSHVALLVVENEAWLTQNQLAELFDTSVQNIALHIKNILEDSYQGLLDNCPRWQAISSKTLFS